MSSSVPRALVRGVVHIPGDKSISHRYAMLAAIAEGTSRFHNFSAARDCASTLDCVAKLGCEWKRLRDEDGGAIEVRGVGPRLNAPAEMLDCGNSGSTMRMLSGILAGQPFTSELCGDESLSRRPMARIMKPLAEMGAKISSSEGGRPPLKIHGGPLKAIHYRPEVASAQVKSCVLFAGLFADWRDRGRGADPHARSWRNCAAGIWRGSRAQAGIRRGSPADSGCARLRRMCPAIFRAPRSFCARRRCFPDRRSRCRGF